MVFRRGLPHVPERASEWAPRRDAFMNLSHFFEHWQISENPFRGEEARHDAVFAKVGIAQEGRGPSATHSDFEKILGDPARPSTSIVFGEKGSGKTAIRLQLSDHFRAHNREHPNRRVMVIAYDDLNGQLDWFRESALGERSASKKRRDEDVVSKTVNSLASIYVISLDANEDIEVEDENQVDLEHRTALFQVRQHMREAIGCLPPKEKLALKLPVGLFWKGGFSNSTGCCPLMRTL